jgi:hypothetical protein
MKKLILAAAALLVSIAAYGQGQVVINNRLTPDVNARLILAGTDPAGGTSSSIGTDYTVNFFGGATGSAFSAAQALNPASSTLRGAAGTATAGYFTGVTATVPGVDVGGKADIWVQVVNTASGAKSTPLGPFSATLGGGTVVPPNLAMGTTPLAVNISVPEPTTLALGALGLGALLAVRRRK